MLRALIIKIIPFNSLKVFFLKFLGAKIGAEFKIGLFSTIYTQNYSNIIIGNYVEIGHNVNIKVSKLKIDNFSMITSNVIITGNGNLTIGKGVYIPSLFIDTSGGVQVGDFTGLAPNGLIYSHNFSHAWFNPGTKYETYKITIGKRSWFGAGSSILNSSVGDESLIAAGSIIFQDIPDNSFAIGNPARVLKANTLNKISISLFNDEFFKKDLLNSYKNNKILFTENLNEIFQAYEIIICNTCSIDTKKIKATVLEINKSHIHNMKKSALTIIKELRNWGIFLSD